MSRKVFVKKVTQFCLGVLTRVFQFNLGNGHFASEFQELPTLMLLPGAYRYVSQQFGKKNKNKIKDMGISTTSALFEYISYPYIPNNMEKATFCVNHSQKIIIAAKFHVLLASRREEFVRLKRKRVKHK